jgi:antitoxin component YwqK of YwqJK toxin-antitoxin module
MFRLLILGLLISTVAEAQIPKPKRDPKKKQTLEEKIEENLPLMDATLPKASGQVGDKSISSVDDAKKLFTETLPDLGLKVSKKYKDLKKAAKSLKKDFNGRDYEGIAVQKQYFRQGTGRSLTYYEFFTLRTYQQPNPYSRHIYWYDRKANRIVEGIGRDKNTNEIMHGPYKKYVDEQLVEEGWYYLGTKHERWETYDKDFNLIDKVYYDKGNFADSEVSYYDDKKEKIKEVKPKLFGKVTGEYLFFNESGTLATQGMMDDSVQVKEWIEYYPTGNRRKKVTHYPKDCYDKETESYVAYEYDEKGKIVFESPKVKKN